MASNDSNEPGNDTAAAFQVKDTVAYNPMGRDAIGVIERAYIVNNNGPFYDVRLTSNPTAGEGRIGDNIVGAIAEDLTLISRATPAPAPAQTAPERNSFAMTMPCWFGKHAECDGTLRVGNVATPDVVSSPCECECHATPAPAAVDDRPTCRFCGREFTSERGYYISPVPTPYYYCQNGKECIERERARDKTPAATPPAPYTPLQRALNAMDRAVELAERFNGVEVVTEALEAIRQAVHALADSAKS